MKELNLGQISHPELIVMLTHHDYTVKNAADIFKGCSDTKAKYWGMKEAPLPVETMKEIFSYMKDCGKTTVLEVVSYNEESGLKGAELAVKCGCDILMGTKCFPSIIKYCKANNIIYLPFVGSITDRPSVLHGNAEEIIGEAKHDLDLGAAGIDLLGYRYVGDATVLNKLVCNKFNGKVCIAGSIDSFERLDEIKDANPDFFTIGSAFFENKFGDTFAAQIDAVCDYMTSSDK